MATTLQPPALCLGALLTLAPITAGTQELVPRAFWPSPVGTNVLSLSYQHSRGDIIVDQSLPVTGVDSSIDYFQLSYQRTLDIVGRTANFSLIQFASDGNTSATVEDEPVTRRTVGIGDTTVRLAINLLGAPAMDREGFAALRVDPKPIVGASLSVTAPTGVYDSDRIINIGANRWSVKPGVGVIYPLTPSWLLEGELSVAFFEDNDNFVGEIREQEPVANAQFHLIKRFSRGFWVALDANYYVGGRTRVGGSKNQDLQRNSRFGATFVYPLAPGNALRFGASTGTVTETGGDYDLFSLSWIHAF
ncbi:transporter [Congregibacter litoralis]|uniref:Putative MetA-pathway of phenol degradation n=1 Tax=Congregibacter litoralis KT71 TaxID=314285 RepID=A4A6J0_9GAMM|nr:transporter [Congregibacter litoralis]EAQ98637.1 putative MetA-pathway of phenol degradation [Congregibacter litoralis KT71]